MGRGPTTQWAVPANAGTHHHRRLLEQNPLATVLKREGAAYGSPLPARNCALGGDDLKRLRSKPVAPTRWGLLFGAAHELDTWLCGPHQSPIGGEIVERHTARGETSLELISNRILAQGGNTFDSLDHVALILTYIHRQRSYNDH